jgi:hypothetical protein
MAVNKAKRSIPSAQHSSTKPGSTKPGSRKPGSTKPGSRAANPLRRVGLLSPRRLFRYPQARGKTVDAVEFSTDSGFHAFSINFDDRTSLTFEIETGFTVEAAFSDWKTGNQRVLRSWRKIKSST